MKALGWNFILWSPKHLCTRPSFLRKTSNGLALLLEFGVSHLCSKRFCRWPETTVSNEIELILFFSSSSVVTLIYIAYYIGNEKAHLKSKSGENGAYQYNFWLFCLPLPFVCRLKLKCFFFPFSYFDSHCDDCRYVLMILDIIHSLRQEIWLIFPFSYFSV